MNRSREHLRIIVAVALLILPSTRSLTSQDMNIIPGAANGDQEEPRWAFGASMYAYFLPEETDVLLPIFMADRDWLHLEARYNYEDRNTVSGWFGYNVSVGNDVSLDFTAMVGGVIGNTSGIAPGFRAVLGWWRLELSTEGEYVYDLADGSDSFFYSWNEFRVYPLDWLSAGMVAQRTRVYQTELDLQRGLLVGMSVKGWTVTGYLFNPDRDQRVYVVGVGYEF
jgi:hypothetical protein